MSIQIKTYKCGSILVRLTLNGNRRLDQVFESRWEAERYVMSLGAAGEITYEYPDQDMFPVPKMYQNNPEE